MAFGEDQDPNIGKSTQFPHNNPRKGGRKKSVRRQLQLLLEGEGTMTIPKGQIIKVDPETGDVTIRIPTDQQLALKLLNMTMGKNGSNTLNAMRMFVEQTDGKMIQPVEIYTPDEDQRTPDQIQARIDELQKKVNGETD